MNDHDLKIETMRNVNVDLIDNTLSFINTLEEITKQKGVISKSDFLISCNVFHLKLKKILSMIKEYEDKKIQ